MLLPALIFVAAVIAFLRFSNKVGSIGRSNGCGNALFGFVFSTSFGLLVVLFVAVIVTALSGGTIDLFKEWGLYF